MQIGTYAPVKSDPWKKGLRRPRRRFQLWPGKFWKRLVDQARNDWTQDVSPRCQEMIAEMNALLYG